MPRFLWTLIHHVALFALYTSSSSSWWALCNADYHLWLLLFAFSKSSSFYFSHTCLCLRPCTTLLLHTFRLDSVLVFYVCLLLIAICLPCCQRFMRDKQTHNSTHKHTLKTHKFAWWLRKLCQKKKTNKALRKNTKNTNLMKKLAHSPWKCVSERRMDRNKYIKQCWLKS